MTLIEFSCHDTRFGVPLERVRRALPSALPVPLPGAPDIVHGVLNVGGEIVTIVDFHTRVGLPPVPIAPSQTLLVLELSGFQVAFIVDEVLGVAEREAAAGAVPDRYAAADFVAGVTRLDDGLCLIVDPERFLLEDEKLTLRGALGSA